MPPILILKAVNPGDDKTGDLFGSTHLEPKTRKDGVVQRYAVKNKPREPKDHGPMGIEHYNRKYMVPGDIYDVSGMPFRLENARGSTRSKTPRSGGPKWEQTMQHHYGDLVGTTGADGDAIDAYVGKHPLSGHVTVINQHDKEGAFNEHKVMLHFKDHKSAMAGYLAHYPPGWNGAKSTAKMTTAEFRKWLRTADKTVPAGPAVPGKPPALSKDGGAAHEKSVMANLAKLGWEDKGYGHARIEIGGGRRSVPNPKGVRGIYAKVKNGDLVATFGDDVVANAGPLTDPKRQAKILHDQVQELPPIEGVKHDPNAERFSAIFASKGPGTSERLNAEMSQINFKARRYQLMGREKFHELMRERNAAIGRDRASTPRKKAAAYKRELENYDRQAHAGIHRAAVERAKAAGKHVSIDAIKDYPDLYPGQFSR